MDINFEDLAKDHEIIARLKQVNLSVDKIEDILRLTRNPELYDELTNGIDPTKEKIKSENDRLKKAMARAKEINDKNTKMPRINKKAAQRFVRSGLWEPRDNMESSEQEERTWDCP